MKDSVSKVRARKIRWREKQAERSAAQRTPFLRRPVCAVLAGLLLWVITIAILNFERLAGAAVAQVPLLNLAGDAVFLLAGLAATALALQVVAQETFRNNVHVLLLTLVALLAMVIAKAVIYGMQTVFLIRPEIVAFMLPLAIAPLMTTILLNGKAGFVIGVWTSFVGAVMLDGHFPALIMGLLASVVAAHVADRVRTRARVVRAGLVVGLSQVLLVLAVTALNWRTAEIMLVIDQAGACLISGFLSALVVLLVLPGFEWMFRITTDLTLLDLSDLSHPLLQRLAMEAPGTYHHSLIVANLAQSAADDIGANSLLARVCAYFHDIGKLTKPDFFAENIQRQINPHDDLPPSMSTLVITAHVKEGLTLAMMHKLPDPVRAVILEHHGTSLVTCFHHKAQQQNGEDGAAVRVDEGDFRYPGPRPSFKESAIIALADSVEAASRSLEKYTPAHIEQVVSNIATAKLTDGQLDNSPLTLAELSRVKRSFIFTLTNMLHGRVPYPQDEDSSAKPAGAGTRQRPKGSSPERVPDGTGVSPEPGSDVA